MRNTGRLFRTILVLMVMIVGLSAAMPLAGAAKPGDNGDPGNSGAAKQCQKGGWDDLYGFGGLTSANQGECVSYAATGGLLFESAAVIEVSFRDSEDGDLCWADVRLIGFVPGTAIIANTYLYGSHHRTVERIASESGTTGFTDFATGSRNIRQGDRYEVRVEGGPSTPKLVVDCK